MIARTRQQAALLNTLRILHHIAETLVKTAELTGACPQGELHFFDHDVTVTALKNGWWKVTVSEAGAKIIGELTLRYDSQGNLQCGSITPF